MSKRDAAKARRKQLDAIRFDFATGHVTLDAYRATLRDLGFADGDRLPAKRAEYAALR